MLLCGNSLEESALPPGNILPALITEKHGFRFCSIY